MKNRAIKKPAPLQQIIKAVHSNDVDVFNVGLTKCNLKQKYMVGFNKHTSVTDKPKYEIIMQIIHDFGRNTRLYSFPEQNRIKYRIPNGMLPDDFHEAMDYLFVCVKLGMITSTNHIINSFNVYK